MANLNLQNWADAFVSRRMVELYRTKMIYGVAAFVGAVAGAVSSDGRPEVSAIFAGFIAAIAVASSRKALFWFVILGGLVGFGVAQLYLPGAKYIRYIVPLASVFLVLHGITDQLSGSRARVRTPIPGMLLWAIAFIVIALVSGIVNLSDPGVVSMGMKGYFQMWALLLAFILIRWRPETIDSIPKGMVVIGFLQLPFVWHQYFVLVPMRIGLGEGIVPVDVVSGTFGATLYGGGANAVLAGFMIILVACLLSLWKHGALSAIKAVTMSLVLLSPVFVNETKISALYLPLVFIVLFYKEIIAKPLKFLLAGTAVAALLAALLTALTLGQSSVKPKTWNELIDFTIEKQTASISSRSGQFSELSRWTALTFWVNEHAGANPVYILLGHGPGASRVQEGGLNLATTLAETRYGGLQIGYTALSALLWDTGILGVVAVLGMFIAAFRTAHWLAEYYRERDATKAGIFDGLSAAIALLALSLAHKDFFVFHIPYQTLVLLIIGYLAIARMQIPAVTR